MKTTLEFSEDERGELQNAINGGKFKAALWNLDEWLRNKEKYEDIVTVRTAEVRDKIRELAPEVFE